jgi:hypothetical protein
MEELEDADVIADAGLDGVAVFLPLVLLGLRDARGDGSALAVAGLELGEGFADAGVAKAAYMLPADLTG